MIFIIVQKPGGESPKLPTGKNSPKKAVGKVVTDLRVDEVRWFYMVAKNGVERWVPFQGQKLRTALLTAWVRRSFRHSLTGHRPITSLLPNTFRFLIILSKYLRQPGGL